MDHAGERSSPSSLGKDDLPRRPTMRVHAVLAV
jgi:hypothetical protein